MSTDPLARAADALRDTPTPPGPSPETLARTRAALRAADRPTLWHPRFTMRTLAAAAAVLLAVGIAYTFGAFTPSAAYADIAEKFRAARTLSFRTTATFPGAAAPITSRTLYRAPNGSRLEMGDTITIHDLAANSSIVLNAKQKTALRVVTAKDAAPAAPDEAAVGIIDLFRKLPAQPGQTLASREIGGVKAKGYAVDVGGLAFRVWADAKTGLPLQAELTQIAGGQELKSVLDQFVFDAELDEALFRTDVPAGYTLQEVKVPTPPEAKLEDDVAALLKWVAGKDGGKFPVALNDWGHYAILASKDSKDGKPSETDLLAMARAGRITATMSGLKSADHGYAGKGKKLGDAGLVFWYKPAGAANYRAVAGDLSVRDVNDVPK